MSSRGPLIRLLPAVFGIQAGFHGFTAALPVALSAAHYREAQIGIVVGTAFVVQMIAAPVVGALLDRVGPHRMMQVGVVAYLAATALMAMLPLDAADPVWGWMTARTLQGLGNAVVIPAALTLVPLLVAAASRGMWLAFVLLAQNMTLALLPAASLLILDAASFPMVALSVGAVIIVGAILAHGVPRTADSGTPDGAVGDVRATGGTPPTGMADVTAGAARTTPRRAFRLTYRRAWTSPLAITVLAIAYWGVIFAYLPPRAEMAGTSSALFFVGYGVAVIASRVLTGWLADRYPARLLVGVGLVLSTATILLLIQPPSAVTLVSAGIFGGVSAGLILSPMLLELSYRSSRSDRGSAFALFSVTAGGANALGSIGVAPIIETHGFEVAMLLGLVGVVAAFVLTMRDRTLGNRDALVGDGHATLR